MNITITFPSFVFVPWTRLRHAAMLNGSGFEIGKPIFWSDIPSIIDFSPNAVRFLTPEDRSSDYIAYALIESFYTIQQPIFIFGDEEVLFDVMGKLHDPDMRLLSEFKYTIHYARDERFKSAVRYLFQINHATGQMLFVRHSKCYSLVK